MPSTAVSEPLGADVQPIQIDPPRLLTATGERGALFAILDLLGAHETASEVCSRAIASAVATFAGAPGTALILHATLAGPVEPADALIRNLDRVLHPLAVSHGGTITEASQQGYTRYRALRADTGLLPTELIGAHVRAALINLAPTPDNSDASSDVSEFGNPTQEDSPLGGPGTTAPRHSTAS